MSKVHYLNSHLHKFREKSKITIDVENIGDLAHYNFLGKEDKKTTKEHRAYWIVLSNHCLLDCLYVSLS